MTNAEAPLEVNVMVSHAWGENAKEFVEALERSTTQDDVLFICAFCVYQNEDKVGPTIEEQLEQNLQIVHSSESYEVFKAVVLRRGCFGGYARSCKSLGKCSS